MPLPNPTLEKICKRLNPCIALDVDVLAVSAQDTFSSADDWATGVLTQASVDTVTQALRIQESGSLTLFSSPGTSGAATDKYHWLNTSNSNGGEIYWFDFWPDPSVLGVSGFTLHSMDVVIGRKDGGVTFGNLPGSGQAIPNQKFLVTVARIDTNFNREIVGDTITISASDLPLNPGLYTLNFRNIDRTFHLATGRATHRTGSGRTSAGAERTANFIFEDGDKKVSRLDLPFGFSIGIQLSDATVLAKGASLGMVSVATGGAWDTTNFWRSAGGTSDARDCGPFSPDAGGTAGIDTTKNPGYGGLETGAVPGFGALVNPTTIAGNHTGQWGVSRQVITPGKPQTGFGQEPHAWQLPWFVLRGVQYFTHGTGVFVLNLGHTPTKEVHFRSDTVEPLGTSVTYSVRGSNTSNTGPWTALNNGGPGPYDGCVFNAAVPITINNGDFETSASIPPVGWVASSATLSYATGGAQFAGTRSLQVTTGVQFGAALSDVLPAIPGEVYTISGAVKTTGGKTGDIQLMFLDSNGNYIAGAQTFTTSATYVTVSSSAVAPANTAFMRVSLQIQDIGGGTAVFDNIVVTQGGALYQWYEVTASLTSSIDNLSTPSLVALSITERTRFFTFPYSTSVDSSSSIDPVTAQSEIGELKLPLLKGGRKDFRDLVTQISSNYFLSQVEAWVYIRDTIRKTRWFLNSYRLEDRDPQNGEEDLTFVSGMDRLTALVPAAQTTFQFPSDDTIAPISAISFNTTTHELTVTAVGTPFAGFNISNMRVLFYGNALDRLNFKIAASPSPTNSTFVIVLEDITQVPGGWPTNTPPLGFFKVFSDVTSRQEVVYSGIDFSLIYADLLQNQAAVPARYRGKLPATQGRTGTGRLVADGVIARQPLQDIALHCQGAMYWGKGQINFADLYSKGDSVAFWSERDYVTLKTPTGYNRRMPSIDVKYGYDYVSKKFANEVVFNDADAVSALGRANLFDVTELPDSLCKWNDVNEGPFIGQLLLQAWSTGVRIWEVELVCPHPWVEFGDHVTISTDQYTDKRPLTTTDSSGNTLDISQPIRGRVTAVGVIVGKNLLGTQFLVALTNGLQSITVTQGNNSIGGVTGEAAGVPCPAITLSFQVMGTRSSGVYQVPELIISFTAPTSPFYDRMEFLLQAGSNTAATSTVSKTSPVMIPYVTRGVTYTVTPTSVSNVGIRTVGTPVSLAIPVKDNVVSGPTPTVIVAQGSGSPPFGIGARLTALGYPVTYNLGASVNTCRAYDAVVVDYTFGSADSQNQFIKDLIDDGQRVLVSGNDSGTGLFYILTASLAAPNGTVTTITTPDQIYDGVGTGTLLGTDGDNGRIITSYLGYARVLSTYAGGVNISGLRIIYPAGGMVIHEQSLSNLITNSPSSTLDSYLTNIIEYLAGRVVRQSPSPTAHPILTRAGVRPEAGVDSQPASVVSRSIGGQSFIEDWESLPANWNLRNGSQNIDINNTTSGIDGTTGGRLLRATGYVWLAYPFNIPYDPSKLYRMRIRWRQRADPANGQKFFYAGVEGVAYDGVTLVNTSGSNSSSSQHYICMSNVSSTAGTTFREDTGWFKGLASTGSGTPSTDPKVPSVLHNSTRYFRPLFIANFNGGDNAGLVDIDYLAIDIFDEEAQRRLYAAIGSDTNLGTGILGSVGVVEGSSTFKLYRHREDISILGPDSDGDVAYTFAQVYQNVPLMALKGGQYVVFSNTLGTGGKQKSRVQPLNLIVSSFTSRCQITGGGTITAQSQDFASGNSLVTAGDTAVITLSPGAAFDNTYTFHYFVTVTVNSNATTFCTATLTIALDSNDGSGWVERATYSYSASPASGPPPYSSATTTIAEEIHSFVVSGLASSTQVRIRAKTFTVTGGGSGSFTSRGGDGAGSNTETYHGLQYNTSSGGTTESAIPDTGDTISWVSAEVS